MTHIVEEIEKQLTRIDAGVAMLKHAQRQLERQRAAILRAACEGRLVPTEAELARAEGRSYDTPSVNNNVPVESKRSVLHNLPEGWQWTNMGALLTGIEAGASFKCNERKPTADDIGVIKVSAVTWGRYDEDESKTCTDVNRVDSSLFVATGDFLFSRANTIDLVGACVIAERVTRRVMLSDKILRFRLRRVEPKWVLYVLRSLHGRREIESLATGNQESMRNIGQERIRQIRVPLPPLAEQRRIVREVDRLLSTLDETAKAVRTQLTRATRLRQSVLKLAFEGKLVPQDPSDEPASVLLDRIRAERSAAEPAKRPGRRAGRRSVAEST